MHGRESMIKEPCLVWVPSRLEATILATGQLCGILANLLTCHVRNFGNL